MHARVFVFAVLSFAVGCGSSVDTETGTSPGDDTGTTGDSTASDTGAAADSGSAGDSTITDTGSGGDTGSATSESGPSDAPGVSCGSTTCPAGEVCCATPGGSGVMFACSKTGCPDGGGTIACDGPEDCSGGTPICCAHAEVTGSGFMCSFKSGSAECTATCKSSVPAGCPGSATIRPCHTSADCTETGYKTCCQFSSSSGTATFCTPDFATSFATKCF